MIKVNDDRQSDHSIKMIVSQQKKTKLLRPRTLINKQINYSEKKSCCKHVGDLLGKKPSCKHVRAIIFKLCNVRTQIREIYGFLSENVICTFWIFRLLLSQPLFSIING
jgi:hypothetical protein